MDNRNEHRLIFRMGDHLKGSNMLPHNVDMLGNSNTNNSSTNNVTSAALNVSTTKPPNPTFVPQTIPACDWLLYEEIGHSRVRVWDLVILIPNAIFLLFLVVRLKRAVVKLQRTKSPIFFAFYGMVFLVAVISVLRCVVSMTVNAAVPAGDITDKVLWLILRFFLLATELSVVIFGLAFGHLDSKTSIRRVLLVTTFIALAYSVTQGALEFMYPDDRFHIIHDDREYDIFGHGGMLFWFFSSVFFFVIYIVICILPFTSLRNRFALPSKKSFYLYCGLLAVLNLLQAIGSGLLYYSMENGLCLLPAATKLWPSIVDVTTYLYFTGYAPLVYGTFLRDFFATSQPPNILFSYKAQMDEGADEDSVSMPHQIYTPTGGRPGEAVGDVDHPAGASVDSTHFDERSPNPLYNATDDLHFPINAELKMSFESDYFGQTPEGAVGVGYVPTSLVAPPRNSINS